MHSAFRLHSSDAAAFALAFAFSSSGHWGASGVRLAFSTLAEIIDQLDHI